LPYQQNLPRVKILKIDDREPGRFATLIAELCTIPIQITRLETGDYVCEDVAIERKTINDFALSIMGREKDKDGRLWTQTKRMRKQFPHHYVLTTDGFDNLEVNIHRHAFLGALASVLKSGTSVCFNIDNDEDFVYLLLKIFEKHGKLRLVASKPKRKKKVKPPVETEVFAEVV